ncbi:hypothetical protein QUB33_03125 [Microcoleus sp. B3-A4]|uniref:hypothetical protein n=1 Tax=Microcoleus sp. B3-A4 TaxID=2818653 RepID=UPI002FD3EEB2
MGKYDILTEKELGNTLNGGWTGPIIDQSTLSVPPKAARSLTNVRLTASTGGAHRISRVPIAVPAADIFSDRVFGAIAANSEVRSLCNSCNLKG